MKRGFLSGGRAPRSWLRGIARAVDSLRVLRRATAWLGPLAVERPRLREEPLLGRSLAEIALREPPAAVSEAEARHPAKKLPSHSAGRTAPRARRETVPFSRKERSENIAVEERGSERAAAPEPLNLPRRVRRDLLARQAGEIRDLPQTAPSSAPLPRPSTKPEAPPAVPRDSKTRRGWLRNLSHRAARRTASWDLPEPVEREPLSEVTGKVEKKGFVESAPVSASRPADPWETPLQGEQAPPDLLRLLAAPPSAKPRPEAVSRAPERPASSPSQPAPSARPDKAGSGLPPADRIIPSAPPPPPGPAREDGPAPTADARIPSLSGLLDAALPPLLPPKDAGAPAPWKAPAQVPALVGRPDAETPEEDLGRLAANLKRILDEEARRHGIDV